MKIEFQFYQLASLPIGYQPCVVSYDFEERGYSREMIKAWLAKGLLTREQYEELLSRLPEASSE